MKKYIILILSGLLIFGIAKADTINSLPQWVLINNILKPIVTSSTIQVPSLGSAGNPCLIISNASGTVATSTCGGGFTTAATSTRSGYYNISTTTTGFTLTIPPASDYISSSTSIVNSLNFTTGNLSLAVRASGTVPTFEGGGAPFYVNFPVANSGFYAPSSYVATFNGATGTATYGVTCTSGCSTVTSTTSTAITVTAGGSVSTSSPASQFNFPYWFNTTGGLSGTSTMRFDPTTGAILIGTSTAPTGSIFYVATTSPIFFINSNGNIGVGTTTPVTALSVQGTIRQTNGVSALALLDSSGGIGAYSAQACTVGSLVTSISATGGVSCVTTSTILTGYSTTANSVQSVNGIKGAVIVAGAGSVTVASSSQTITVTGAASTTFNGSSGATTYNIAAGTGISVSTTTTIGTITNVGVTSITTSSPIVSTNSTGTVALSLASQMSSSSVSVAIFDATTTSPYSFAKWRTSRAITLAEVSCDEKAAATTTLEVYKATALATTTNAGTVLASIACGINGTTNTSLSTTALAYKDFLIFNVTSTAGTPTMTTVNVFYSVN